MKLFVYNHDFYKGGIDTFLLNLLNNNSIYNQFEIELYTSIVHPSYIKYLQTLNPKIKVRKFFLPDISEINFYLKNKLNITISNKIIIFLKYPLIFFYSIILFFWFIFKKPNIFFFVSGGLPGPDINLSFLFAKLLTKPFFNIKYIFNFHNFATKSNSKIKKYYSKIIFMITYYLSDKLITVSNSVILDTSLTFNLSNYKKLKFIHNGSKKIITHKKNSKQSLKDELNINKNYYVFTVLGTLDERKGHKFLLEVYKKLLKTNKQSHLLICGDGSKEEKSSLFDIINTLDINDDNLSFLGYINDVEKIFSITDTLLIGSQFGESFGFPAIEAMQRKIPFISTNFGGLDEVIIEGSGGYKANYNSKEEYLEKIIKLLNLNSNELSTLKHKGYERYLMNFTDDIMSEKYKLIFLE